MSLIQNADPSFLSGFYAGFTSGIIISFSGLLPISIGIVIGTVFGDSFGIKNIFSEILTKLSIK